MSNNVYHDLAEDVLWRARRIRLAIFDVDGVLTDGRLYYGPDGEVFKAFNSLDGHGIKMLIDSGIEVAIISGRSGAALERRAADLGIRRLHTGVSDKRATFETLLAELKLDLAQCAAIGDDIVDLPILAQCGLSAAVANAPRYLKERVHFVTRERGGEGAAREFCDLILDARGELAHQIRHYGA
ncbi:MAG TPA: HAD family hydrolase [Usitatibacteraceae bacterium]|nr:HAD family hydrolase [Usitatibacteraceae bacterium]